MALLATQFSQADQPDSEPATVDAIAAIDQHMRQYWLTHEIDPAQPCSDREFVRRVTLDLAGRVPTLSEMDSYLADEREDRRERWVDEIKQAHYWGLVAFFNRGQNVKSDVGPRVVESAVGGFSQFANLSGDSSPNLLSFLGAETVDEARPGADEEQIDSDDLYFPVQIDGTGGTKEEIAGATRVPKFSRRQQFVDQVLSKHRLLPRAMVNRLWAIMLGRGIIHPYDEMDSMHVASQPELLDWLADDFAQHFDIRRTLRSLALSEVYQLQSLRPVGVEDPSTFAWYLERQLTGEQMARSIQVVVRGSVQGDEELLRDFRQQLTEVLPDESLTGVDDALFFANGSALEKFLAESSTDEAYLIAQVSHLGSHSERCQQLFLAALGREATAEEVATVVNFLEHRPEDLEAAVRHILWSLVTSAEFQLNH